MFLGHSQPRATVSPQYLGKTDRAARYAPIPRLEGSGSFDRERGQSPVYKAQLFSQPLYFLHRYVPSRTARASTGLRRTFWSFVDLSHDAERATLHLQE